VGQHSPGPSTTRDDVEDGACDLAQGVQPGASRGFGGGQMGLYVGPLGIGEVGLWYALLMLGILPSYSLSIPFHTVSEYEFSEVGLPLYGVLGSSA
jgi:hypothetical protein